MEFLSRGDMLISYWQCCSFIMACSILSSVFCTVTEEDCDMVINNRGMSGAQLFLPTKIQMHHECISLFQHNTTDAPECPASCNDAIEDLVAKNGRILFTCTCSTGSNVYNPEECHRDRERLYICPALSFLTPIASPSTPPITIAPTSTTSTVYNNYNRPTTETKETSSSGPIGMDCRWAGINCKRGEDCSKAFYAVVDNCRDGFSASMDIVDYKCSQVCKRSVDRIDRFPAAKDLWGCKCDPDSEEFTWCPMYNAKNGIKKLCDDVTYKLATNSKENNSDNNSVGSIHDINLLALVSILTTTLIIRLTY